MINKFKFIFSLVLVFMLSVTQIYGYELKKKTPIVDKYQTYQCMKDRHATKEFLNDIDYVYSYSKKVGIDPSIVMGISAIETGYGKSHLFKAYNNPGGIKARHGWKRFKTTKEGYKYMINLLGIYAGIISSNSYLFGRAPTTEQLGNYYWVENGCDRGYHRQLTRMINAMDSYPSKPKAKPKKNKTIKKIKTTKNNTKKKSYSAIDLIYDIINDKSNDFNAYKYMMDFTK